MSNTAENGSAGGLVLATRVTLSVEEACAALGVSYDFWREHVEPEVPVVRRGRRKMVPVRKLEEWAEANAELALDGAARLTAVR